MAKGTKGTVTGLADAKKPRKAVLGTVAPGTVAGTGREGKG